MYSTANLSFVRTTWPRRLTNSAALWSWRYIFGSTIWLICTCGIIRHMCACFFSRAQSHRRPTKARSPVVLLRRMNGAPLFFLPSQHLWHFAFPAHPLLEGTCVIFYSARNATSAWRFIFRLLLEPSQQFNVGKKDACV